MSDCLHCDILEMLQSHHEGKEADLAEVAANVTQVLADLILMAPPDGWLTSWQTSAGWYLKKAKKLTQTVPAVQATEAIAQEFRMTMLKVCALAARPDTIVASAAPEGHANSERSMQGSFNMRRDGCPFGSHEWLT
jgi:hypothetical protein